MITELTIRARDGAGIDAGRHCRNGVAQRIERHHRHLGTLHMPARDLLLALSDNQAKMRATGILDGLPRR
jgi:hypothetical protein